MNEPARAHGPAPAHPAAVRSVRTGAASQDAPSEGSAHARESAESSGLRQQSPTEPPAGSHVPVRSSKAALLWVGLVSAVIAGGSAYYLARATRTQPSWLAAPPAAPLMSATIRIEPADAQVSTRSGALPVSNGHIELRGNAGETLEVVVAHRGRRQTFAVFLGSDGSASPARLALSPE